MMRVPGSNEDTEAALRYHEATKHSEERLRSSTHFLDWDNRPQPFKIYRGVPSIALPSDLQTLIQGTPPALEAIAPGAAEVQALGGQGQRANLATLSRVLYLAAGVTKRKRYPGGEMSFRAYANTGALYHIDLYVVSGAFADLPAGVYHFGPHDFSLHRLRSGDYRRVLAEACGDHARVLHAPLILVSASTYWRNAWKYQARTYRHCFWDAGTLYANLLAIAGVEALQPLVVLGFADAMVTWLLGLDRAREAALSVVALGHTKGNPPQAPALPELAIETLPLSRSEVDYPRIREMHAASSLDSGATAAAWCVTMPEPQAPPAGGPVYPIEAKHRAPCKARSLADIIRRRGSTRAFDATRAISFGALSTVLDLATRPIPADVPGPAGATLLELYLIVHAVDGLPCGSYYYRRGEASLELLRQERFRAQAARLALGQELAGAAAVNVYSLCSLPGVLARFGNRGYRAAQLEGGIIAGRMYLGAYALGFGASGLTFFDDEVTAFFSPHAAGKSVMFLIALGYSRRASGPLLARARLARDAKQRAR